MHRRLSCKAYSFNVKNLFIPTTPNEKYPNVDYSIKVVINAAKILDCDISTVTLPIQTNQIISKCRRIIKISNKMERKKQTGHVCRWMAFGITIVTIIVGCTIVIGLFEWRDISRMENRNSETLLWRKSIYDLNMRVAKLSPLGETMEKH